MVLSAALRLAANAFPGNAGGGHGAFMVATKQRLIRTAELPAELSEMQGSKKDPRTTSATRTNEAISKVLQGKYIRGHVEREVTDGTKHFIRSRRERRFRCRQGRRGEALTATALDPPDRTSRHRSPWVW